MNVFLARQPILDTKQKIFGYEIFYRNNPTNRFPGTDEDEATSEVMIDTFQSIGLESITGGLPAFINFSRHLLEKQVATLFSHKHLVIEVLESVKAEEPILTKCRELKDAGYILVLDDFVYGRGRDAFLDLVHIVKLDLLSNDLEQLQSSVKSLHNRGLTLLAEKVESWEDYQMAEELGFTLFQGYYFSHPEILTATRLTPVQMVCFELIALANEEELNFEKTAETIARDLSLTYSLLRLANSAAFMRRHAVHSIKEALVWIGEIEIKKWVALVALQRMGSGQPQAPVVTSLVRGRFSELLAEKTRWRNQRDQLFLGGVFSLLDVLLQRPLPVILDEIHASFEIKEMLLHQRGPYKNFGALVLAYEQGHWDEVAIYAEKLGLELSVVGEAYLAALDWCPHIGS